MRSYTIWAANAAGELVGPREWYTNVGTVIIVFEDLDKARMVAEILSGQKEEPGVKCAIVDTEEDVVSLLEGFDPEYVRRVTFVPDSGPIFDSIIEHLTQ